MDARMAPRTPVRSSLALFVLLFPLLLGGCLSADGTENDDTDSPGASVQDKDEDEARNKDDTPATEATLQQIVPVASHDSSIISGIIQLSDTADDGPLTGLNADDFKVLENENPLLDTNFLSINPISEFPDLTFTQTLSVVFQSNAALTSAETDSIHDTLRQLIDTMPAHREMAIYSFGEEVIEHISATSDTDTLHEAVDGISHSEGGGYSAALHDALIAATDPLTNSLDLDEGITQGSMLVITRINDRAGNQSREDVTKALSDFPTAILSIDSEVQDDLAGLTTQPLFHPVTEFEKLPEALGNAQASLEAQADATYAFYYASTRRTGDNTMRLGLAPSQTMALDEDLTMDFSADDFAFVSPEIIVFPPDELTPGETIELDLITRWSNQAPEYVIESATDGIDAELINSLERLRITAGEETAGEQTLKLANDAHPGTGIEFSLPVGAPHDGDQSDDGDESESDDEDDPESDDGGDTENEEEAG